MGRTTITSALFSALLARLGTTRAHRRRPPPTAGGEGGLATSSQPPSPEVAVCGRW
jgi:hypothetical protein